MEPHPSLFTRAGTPGWGYRLKAVPECRAGQIR
jgi:hypothetical protein